MASDIETAALDLVSIPPIPGPLPPSFFTDIPDNSKAIFSTLFGTRPFRPLPFPLPVHSIPSGSDNDIVEKSNYLFKRYPTIAESVVAPPVTWQDLYHYFDATDLWMEGAGFLFRVLGHMAAVNITKFSFLEYFVKTWASLNEERLSSMVPCQDMIGIFQTPDDHAWFDYSNMTAHDKEILNSMLFLHCEARQGNYYHASAASRNELPPIAVDTQRILPVVNLGAPVHIAMEDRMVMPTIYSRLPVQMAVDAQGIPYDMPTDPYQHFGRSDVKSPPGLPDKASQPISQHWEQGEYQIRTSSVPPHPSGNLIRYYDGHRGPLQANQYQAVSKNSQGAAKNHYVSPDSYQQFTNDRRRSVHGGRQQVSIQRQPSLSKDPVYVLDPQKSMVGIHKDAFGPKDRSHGNSLLIHPSQQLQDVGFQGFDPQGLRGDALHPNHTEMMSNDARTHSGRRSNPADGGPRSMPKEHRAYTTRKTSWPEGDSNKFYTLYVTGFPREDSAGYHLENLFSECGEITTVRMGVGQGYAFISFKHQTSALSALHRFDRYPIGAGRSLSVRYPKANGRSPSYGSSDMQQSVRGAPYRPWTNDLSSAPTYHAGYDGRENRKTKRHSPPRRHDSYPSKPSHGLPPNPFEQVRDGTTVIGTASYAQEPKYHEAQPRLNLPPKPQYTFSNSTWNVSPSNISQPQLNYTQAQRGTPEKPRLGSFSGQTNGTRRQDSIDRPGQVNATRSHGSENTKSQRKTPKKQKAPPSGRQTSLSEAPIKVPSLDPEGKSPTKESSRSAGKPAAEIRSSNNVSNTGLRLRRIQSLADEIVERSSTPNEAVPKLQDISSCNNECPKLDSSNSISEARSNSVSSATSAGSGHSSTLMQPPKPFVVTNTLTKIGSYENMPLDAAEVTMGVSTCNVELPIDEKNFEITSEILQNQKKKKIKNKKRSPRGSQGADSRSPMDNDVPRTLKHHLSSGVNDESKSETGTGSKANNHTSPSSTASTSTHISSTKDETVASSSRRPSDDTVTLGGITLNCFTTPEAASRCSHRANKFTQSKSGIVDDVFEDMKPAQSKQKQDLKRLSQGEIDQNNVTLSSTLKGDSSSESRSKEREETQTPTRKPQPRHHKNKSNPKASSPSCKENKKSSPSPIEILSDPSNWPALGSTNLPSGPKIGSVQNASSVGNPLVERPMPPAIPIRRDSMASVVSQPLPTARRVTIDRPNSPVPGESPLWPVVKRWDSQGRASVEIGDFAPLISGDK